MDKNDKYLIIYHREDNDGLFSMAIIYNYLVDVMHVPAENIHRLGADYEMMNKISTEKIPGKKYTKLDEILNTYQHIVMTDISFNDFSFIKKIYKKLDKEFVWIDHHAPVIKQSIKEGLDEISGERNTKRSAILNAYKYLYDPFDEKYNKRDESIELFRVLSAFDSWTFKEEGYENDFVFAVNTGITNKYMLKPEKIIPFVHTLLNREDQNIYVDKFYTEGKSYNDAFFSNAQKIVEDFGEEWPMKYAAGRKAVVICHSGQTCSRWFEPFAEKYDNGVVFKHLSTGSWGVSLYNCKEGDSFDCGTYMKEHYGGGGHPGAAGCQLTEEQFIDILKSKTF